MADEEAARVIFSLLNKDISTVIIQDERSPDYPHLREDASEGMDLLFIYVQ